MSTLLVRKFLNQSFVMWMAVGWRWAMMMLMMVWRTMRWWWSVMMMVMIFRVVVSRVMMFSVIIEVSC